MLHVSATQNQEVAHLVSTQPQDWRDQMEETAQLLVTPEELIKPLSDLWAALWMESTTPICVCSNRRLRK